jgi:hypothetical protein
MAPNGQENQFFFVAGMGSKHHVYVQLNLKLRQEGKRNQASQKSMPRQGQNGHSLLYVSNVAVLRLCGDSPK